MIDVAKGEVYGANLALGHSFNRDPESTATKDAAACKQHCWQSPAGSAFGPSTGAKRAPRREIAE